MKENAGYRELEGANAPAQLVLNVPANAGSTGREVLERFEEHAERLGLEADAEVYPQAIDLMVEGTVAQVGELLDAFAADEVSGFGELSLYFDPGTPEPLEYDNPAVDAILQRHGEEENGGILGEVGPHLGMLDPQGENGG